MSPRTTTNAQSLGYAPDERVLIVSCDDLGMSGPVNHAVLDALENGIATSTSLMTPCPASAEAIDLLRARPHLAFGIHLTLLRETPSRPWRPLAPAASVSSLVDDDGFLLTNRRRDELLARAVLADVEREVRAQIEAVLAAGLLPSHLDWHVLADGGRADITELTVGIALEHGLSVRTWLAPSPGRMANRGLPVVDGPFLDSFSLPLEDKQAVYARRLRELPPGLHEWAIHPGLVDEEARSLDPGWRVRASDHAFLVSAWARELIAQEGIVLTDYRGLQQAWQAAR